MNKNSFSFMGKLCANNFYKEWMKLMAMCFRDFNHFLTQFLNI